MPDYDAGSATVRVRPDASGFIRDLRRDLERYGDPGFSVTVEADTRPAVEQIQRLRQAVDGTNVSLNVDLNMATMRARLEEWRRVEESDPIVIPVDVDTTRALMSMLAFRQMQESNSFNVYADVNTTTASSEMARWRREQEANGIDIRVNARGLGSGRGGAGGLTGLGPKIIALASQAPMAALGVAQLGAALQQLSGVGLALPGILGGVVSSVGTLALGLNGVKDAYDAVTQAAETSGADQASQAKQAAAAQNQLRNAVVDEAQAQKDVAQARRGARQQLADLNIEMRGGQISEARALLELQRAKNDLATGDYTDQADAVLRVAETEQNLLEVRARNADLADQANTANAQGVEGSDAVTSANERLVRSQQQVADAQTAVNDATTTASTNATAAAEAMDKLSPSAREFIETLVGVGPQMTALRTDVQENIFAGLAENFDTNLASLMPILQNRLGQIGTGWNETFTSLFNSIGDPKNAGLLDRILGNTGEAQSRFADALNPIIDGVLTLTAAGSDSLPRIADAIGTVAERFANFIEAADADGRLAEWIDSGLTGIGQLGETVLNLLDAFGAVTDAVDGSFLEALEVGSGKLADFLNSTEGQNKLREFFEHGAEMFEAWKPILEALPGIFSSSMEGSGTAVQALLSLLSLPLEVLKEFPWLVEAIAIAFTTFFAGAAIRGAIMGFVGMLGTVQTAVGAKGLMGAIGLLATGPMGVGALAIAAGAAFLWFRKEVDSTIKRAEVLADEIESMKTNLDAVTGRLNDQGITNLINQSRDFTGIPIGGPQGLPAIGGDSLEAARSLGIDPQAFVRAQGGDAAALQQVRDILINNNLLPEIQANATIANQISELTELTGGTVDQDLILKILSGDVAAAQTYQTAIQEATVAAQASTDPSGGIARINENSLSSIFPNLSATGQSSVQVGARLNTALAAIPTAQDALSTDNQAQYGRWRLTAEGGNVLHLPPGADVGVVGRGEGWAIPVPSLTEQEVTRLRDQERLGVAQNADGSWTVSIPPDRLPLVEKYAKGGPTPSGRGPGPTGGFLSELHDDEYVISKHGRAQLPDSFWEAANRGLIKPKMLDGLNIPGFRDGGDPEEEVHGGTGLPPGPQPIAPNTANTGLMSALTGGLTGLSSALTPGTATATSGQPTRQDPFAWLPKPGQDMSTWNPFAGAPEKIQPTAIAAQLGSTLLTGVLSFFGLENSILSPDNEWRQALDQALGFVTSNTDTSASGLDLPASLQVPGAPTGTLSTDELFKQLYGPNADPNAAMNIASTVSATTNNSLSAPSLTAGVTNPYVASLSPGQTVSMATVADWPRLYAPGADGEAPVVPTALQNFVASIGDGTLVAGTRDTGDSLHEAGFAFDISGSTADMQALAEYVRDNLSGQTLQLIYEGIRGNGELAAGAPVDSSYYAQAGNHADHVHWAIAPGAIPGMRSGGPSPSGVGPGPTGGFLAELHDDEYVISKHGRAQLPDSFWDAANRGLIDPAALAGLPIPGFAVGGDPRRGVVDPRPLPPPRIPNAQPIRPSAPPVQSAPVTPSAPLPSPQPLPAPAPQELPSPAPATSAVAKPQTTPVPMGGGNSASGVDHNLGWVDTAIESGAAALGNAASMAASMGMGGMGGGMGGLISGLFGQGGKIAKDAANVVSSFFVGSVPGSMGEPGAPAYGTTLRPDQNRPSTAEYRPFQGTGNTYNVTGYDPMAIRREIEAKESLDMQARLSHRP